jgi:hypothetical protein
MRELWANPAPFFAEAKKQYAGRGVGRKRERRKAGCRGTKEEGGGNERMKMRE